MPAAILLLLLPVPPAAMPVQPGAAADTALVLREVHRDMTGDGAAEILRLTARGDPADSLEVHFTIHAGDALLFEESFALTRRIGWGSRATFRTPAEMLEFVEEYPDWFFDPEKFQSPAAFLADLRISRRTHHPSMDILRQLPHADAAEARAVWREMEEAGVTVFGFSSGGDRAVDIAWSPAHRKFFYVSICC